MPESEYFLDIVRKKIIMDQALEFLKHWHLKEKIITTTKNIKLHGFFYNYKHSCY
jgi:hypothetical protein